jgi:hypothetical protein
MKKFYLFLFLLLTATGFRNKMLGFILTANPNSQTFTSDPLKCYLKERWIEEPTKIYH